MMNVRGFGVVVGLLVASVWAIACDEEREPPPPEVALDELRAELQRVFCDRLPDCDCTDSQFDSRQACETWARDVGTNVDDLIAAYDLQWNPLCMGGVLAAYDAIECGAQELLHVQYEGEPDEVGCVVPCQPLFGDGREGEPCEFVDSLSSTCAADLYCDGAQCRRWCPKPVGKGETCGEAPCEPGLTCNPADARCITATREGGDCSTVPCAEDLRCVDEDLADPMNPPVCRALSGAGGPCMGHMECTTGYCPNGLCAAIPGEGESCRGTGICGEGLACIDDTCGAPKQPGDPCTSTCGPGMYCDGTRCIAQAAAVCWPEIPLPYGY